MLVILLAACDASRAPPLLLPGEPLPELLSDLGYADHPDVMPFEPEWPLWSNGLSKQRWIYLPERRIEVRDDGSYRYPDGALLLKTFSVDGAPAETRAMRRAGDSWDYAVWLWEGDRAEQLPLTEGVPIEDGTHIVPSRFQCRMCHERNGVLGFTSRQVADLEAYDDLFYDLPEHRPLPGSDALTSRVLGGFLGNCVHCHDGTIGTMQSFALTPEQAVSNTVDVETDPSTTAPGVRVVPGSPEASVLFLAVSGEHDNPEVRAMPPLGVQVRDSGFVEDLRDWIDGL